MHHSRAVYDRKILAQMLNICAKIISHEIELVLLEESQRAS